MVTPALHVERGEIEAAGAQRAEEEVANVIYDIPVDRLVRLFCQAAEIDFDTYTVNECRVKEGIPQVHVADRLIIFIQPE